MFLLPLQVLEQLKGDHPLPGMILEHRTRQKLLSGFLTDICSRVKRPTLGPPGDPSTHHTEQYF